MRTRRNKRKNRLTHSVAQGQATGGHERQIVVSTLAGMALLAASPSVHALSLGEINVRSSLGQRLDASIPVQLAAGESLASGCIRAVNGSSNDLSGVPNATVITPEAARPGSYTLRISSAAALYEPIYALKLQAGCAGTAAISRQYVLMLDLPGMTVEQAISPAQPPVSQTGQRPDALPSSFTRADVLGTTVPRQRPPRSHRTLDAMAAPIQPGTRYRVVSGDTLSSIAARVSGRQVNLWTLADQIFAANPAAFIRNDINLIKLGSTIVIPAADTAAGVGNTAAIPATLPLPIPAPETVSVPPVAALPVEPEIAATTQSPAAVPSAPAPVAEVTPVSTFSTNTETVTRPSGPPLAAAETPADTEVSPVAATAAGVVFGLLISALLWVRNRLPAAARKRPVKKAPKPVIDREDLLPVTAAAPLPIAVRTERAEPSITVQWSARPDDPLAAEFATAAPVPAPAPQAQPQADAPRTSAVTTDEITSELEKLFGDDSETMSTPAPAMASMPSMSDDHGPDTDEAETDNTDDQRTETLLQALSLLERDYEAELTASQVLDLSAMREALATGTDSMPFIKKPD